MEQGKNQKEEGEKIFWKENQINISQNCLCLISIYHIALHYGWNWWIKKQPSKSSCSNGMFIIFWIKYIIYMLIRANIST